jgi:pimeloyl-ACP methyl ester carboxylesterase
MADRGLALPRLLVALLSATVLLGCATRPPEAPLSIIYSPSAKFHAPDRNPIIVIPGLLGSRLRDPGSGKLVWGAFDAEGVNPSSAEGFRLISLRTSPPRAIGDTEGMVKTDGVVDRIRIAVAGIPFSLRAYAEILATLGAGGYRDQSLGLGGDVDYGDAHFTCFQFAYDWRLDNISNARRLRDFIREKRAYVQEQYRQHFGIEDADVKFDIVAHSMGGLVTRYYLMFGGEDLPADGSTPAPTWEGARHVERAILIGTPNGGSVDALRALVEGRDFGAPVVPAFRPTLLGTFPSLYQLLPRSRFGAVVWADGAAPPVDIFDPQVWQALGWGLASPRAEADLAVLMPEVSDAGERRRLALDFQARALGRAKHFMAALDQKASPPAGSELLIVAGDAIPTEARVAVVRETGALAPAARAPGDGVVLRSSALLDERVGGQWQPMLNSPMPVTRALFLPNEHLDLTRTLTFRDNVLYWLLEEPRPGRATR